MEEILINVINASIRKAEEDIENEREIINLLDTLAILMKNSNSTEVIGRILSKNLLKALDFFESPRIKERTVEIVEDTFSYFDVDTPEYFNYIQIPLDAGCFEKVALEKLLSDFSHKLIPPNEIKTKLITLLFSKDTSIASTSESIMIKLYHMEDLRCIQNFTDELFSKINHEIKTKSSNAEQVCRILEVAVQVSLKSNEHLRQMEEIIKLCLTNSQYTDDILFQMNIIEILQNLLNSNHGFEYLARNGILKHYAEQILRPDKSLLAPGIMRFFTHAAVGNPRIILNEYSGLVELLLTTIRDDDSYQVVTLETLGQIFLTNDSKRILHEKYDTLCCETLKKLFLSISNSPTNIKIRIFECFEKVFSTDDDANVNNQISYICERWLHESNITFNTLLDYCKQPFKDISLASFGLINSLITFSFGRIAIAQTGGFVEFLLDRSNSISSYDVAMMKYKIVTRLSLATEFDVTTINFFANYVRNGAIYNDQNLTAVDFE